MCRIIVECSTITGSTAYSASGILVKNANFPEEADRNRKRLPSGGRHQSGQSTVLLKNVVPVEGIGSGVGSLQATELNEKKLVEKGPSRVDPLLVPKMIKIGRAHV